MIVRDSFMRNFISTDFIFFGKVKTKDIIFDSLTFHCLVCENICSEMCFCLLVKTEENAFYPLDLNMLSAKIVENVSP